MHQINSLYLLVRTGNFNIFAIVCTVAFIIVTIIVLIVILSVKRHSAKYYTHEDKRNGKSTFSKFQLKCGWTSVLNTNEKSQTFSLRAFSKHRWTVREKHRYTFNHRKRIELQISHRRYHLYDWRGVVAAIPATVDIVYNAERVKCHATAAASSTIRHSSICISAWILQAALLLLPLHLTAIIDTIFKLKREISVETLRAHFEINLLVSHF